MKQITVTEEKKMTVAQRKEAVPYEVLADGIVIATVLPSGEEEPSKFKDTGMTKCPNCKFEYQLDKKDESPYFFSIQHP